MSARKKAPKIAISGYYGYNNCGDEAVLFAIIHCLKKLRTDARIIVFSNDPNKTREEYAVEAVNRWNPISLVLSLLTCRLFISGGGSLIQDVTSSRSAGYYLGVIRIALLLRKKVMIYSQGVGPLTIEKNRIKTRKILERCHLITVRDDRSADLLKELGVKKDIHIVCDPVMAFQRGDIETYDIEELLREAGVPENMGKSRKPLLIVAVRCWKDDRHIAPVAELLDKQMQSGWDVLLIPAHFPGDTDAIKKIKALMAAAPYSLGRRLTARQFIAMTGCADKVFSMRLHGLICAMAMGTPMLGLSYDPKVDGFMEQTRMTRYCLPFDSFDAETASMLLAELDALPPEFSEKQDARRQEMREMSWEAARQAVGLL